MAGEEEDPRRKQSPSSPGSQQWPDEENPLQKLSRYADEQIAAMLHSVMGIPSSMVPPQSDRWAVFEDERNYRDAQRRQRQNYNENGSDHGETSSSPELSPSPRSNYQAASSGIFIPGPENTTAMEMFDSLFNRLWFDPNFFHPYSRSPFANLLSADSTAWPLNYILFSQYSPLQLEHQARRRAQYGQGAFSSLKTSMSLSSEPEPAEPKWREAFEDLLRLENGEQMLDRERNAVAKPESGKEWLQNLINRGSLGNNWKFVPGSNNQPWSAISLAHSNRTNGDARLFPESEEQGAISGQMTELDLYERFIADIEAREREFNTSHHSPLLRFLLEARRRRNGAHPPNKDHNDDDTESWLELVSGGNKRSVPDSVEPQDAAVSSATPPTENAYVISTQVSTERIRLPDGSIQTKTVKTKRFADGREETNESTETVNPPQRDQNSPNQGSTPDQKANGWFWRD
ncbi:hypothetical protein BJY04DRAFT_178766 [Aspergillus karnatakaensis]|uniref:uncharacterized protein n=1 Tax=Aspergillus karnatakaensis TaxID=1810916 RepID=UPI003CCCBF6B